MIHADLSRRALLSFAFAVAATAGLVSQAPFVQAEDAVVSPITITVANMHCPSCAKGVAAQLQKVPGVVTVKMDVAKESATVTPAKDKTPNLKALWAAVEASGFKPTKLVAATGTFTKAPE